MQLLITVSQKMYRGTMLMCFVIIKKVNDKEKYAILQKQKSAAWQMQEHLTTSQIKTPVYLLASPCTSRIVNGQI